MKPYFKYLMLLVAVLWFAIPAAAVNGYYDDPGGGKYWCNVYVAYVSSGKSYSWCTGKSEDAEMNNFRGFESEHNGKVSTQYPTIRIKFRYHNGQAKDFKRNGSQQSFYVMVHGGALHKIGEWPKGGDFKQTDYTYGVIGEGTMDGTWMSFYYTPNQAGIENVTAIQIENDTYYHQDNFWHSDYDFTIHARYLRGIDMGFEKCREASVEWVSPGKVRLSADNSWLPSSMGNHVSNFNYKSNYKVKVIADGNTYSSGNFTVENRGNKSMEIDVPIDKSFKVEVERYSTVSYKYNDRNITLNLGSETTEHSFHNPALNLTAAFNQVEGTMKLQWSDNGIDLSDGDFQVYRTELNNNNKAVGNRSQLGTTAKTSFTDNSNYGLEYNKRYRYEVFQKHDSWDNFSVPSDPDKSIGVNVATTIQSTAPVIPLHLVQDDSDEDNVKMDWEFGNVPKSENDVTFLVHRIEPNGTITRNYLDVTVPRDAGKATFSDEKPASICSNYGYFLQLDLAQGKVHIYSDTVYAHVIGSSSVTSLDVTKGTAGSDVVIKWKAHQIGTSPTLYEVQRRFIGGSDWLTIQEEEGVGSNYSYTDKTTEPGRYYEYRVIAYVSDCDGGGRVISNAMSDVGFCRASGVVSGRVQFDTGTAVEGVRVSLSCESNTSAGQSTHSRSVLEAGNALTFTNLRNLVNDPDKPFTLQFYVRPDSTLETMTLMQLPKLMQLKYNNDNKLMDLTMDNAVVGSIPANEFSQVSIMADGDRINAFIAGNARAVNDTTFVPQQLVRFSNPNYVLLNESGNSLDGWTISPSSSNGWIIRDGAFCSNNQYCTAIKRVEVPESLIGCTVEASVMLRSTWGSRRAIVTATMLDSDNNQLGSVTICNNNSQINDWTTYSTEFEILAGTKYIEYKIIGQDKNNWAGNYGPEFKKMVMKATGLFDGNNWVLFPDFNGYVDELRLWNSALTSEQILADVDRVISGESEGLKAYINFDEGLEEYAFDSSCTNGVPNGNHVTVGANTRPSNVIPTDTQLSSYGMTNDKGEYEIRGIPFTGSGSRYSVYPSKGVHSFNPTSRSAFIGGTSLTVNNVDFTDVSSFKVSGTIRYAGTTIPVDSVSFYVDGMPCNKNDKLIYSNANGEYEISVPIGSHYIEARRNGHTFEGSGRYPVAEGETYEFLSDTHIDFYDNTLVIFAGRVTGGNTEGEKPLGYGVSENTIGKAIITLTPLDHPQRMLNAVQHVQGTTVEWIANTENVAVEGASVDINSTAYRAGGDVDDVKNIVITTDENTGEFSAKIPPIRYMVKSVKFPNNQSIESDEMFSSIPAVNLTNPNDTVVPDTIYTENKTPMPLFKCNRKLMLTYRNSPILDITQVGLPAGAFGTDTITVTDAGQEIKLPIFNYNESTGEVNYNYGYPIFQLGRNYDFKVRAYEPYMNYDKSTAGELYMDMLRDSVVTFGNELGEGALVVAEDNEVEGHQVKRGDMVKLTPDQVQLNSEGEGHYKWNAGVPSLSAPFTRNMNASMVIQGQTKLWRAEGLNGIIAGVVPTGNNFITAGPSHVQMVLRDPPGDASSATWAVDSVTSDYSYTVRGIHNDTEIGVDIRTSLEFDFLSGTAFFGMMTYNTYIGENSVTWKYNVNKTWDYNTTVTYTNGAATSTSSTMDYVGRDGDVFIGYSTNYIIGAADKVGIFKQDDGSWGVDMRETMAMDEKFDTHFEYSQNYIETTLFNNIKRTRNTKLKHINSMSEIEENPAVPTYYTFLTEDDPKYGSSNNDESIWKNEAKNGFDGPSYYARFPENYEGCDSVMWCNEIIAQWKKTLADNEEDKIKAFNDPNMKITNESFERGISKTNSTGTTKHEKHNSVETFSTGVAYKGKNGFLLNKMGAIIISNTEIGYHQTKYDVDETTTSERFSYTLNDTQRGNAHTVDIFESPRGWSTIFRTRGGQTRCPYEGETRTKYFEPIGQLLDYATMKSDNPHISMPVRNFVDIPAGQEAQVQVVFTNESETHEALTSAVVYVDAGSNPNGLQIFMDGEPLVNGVEMWIEYGVPITKTLTIRQSDNSILDYNNITLFLANSCKPEKWIYETVSFSAHFVPAAPDVTLTLDKSILNQRAVQNGEQVVATISDINRMFTGLKGVRLKYRFAGDAQWITAHEWVTNAEYFTEGHETDLQSLMPTDKPNITYNLMLPNIDGHYMVVAESMCMLGGKEYTKMTYEYEVVRDTRGPKLLGQAYPNTGILTQTDDIRIKFNEDIRESYLTKDDNFFITGSLNDAQVTHDVSLQFNGMPVETDAYIPVANTSFSSTLWLKRKSGGNILEHGTEGNMLRIAINDNGQVEATINEITVTSIETVPMDKWVFLATNYVKGAMGNNTLTMLMAVDDNETMLFDEAIMPDYNANGRITLGRGFTGMMHELVLWNKNNPVRTLLAEKDEVKAAYLPGLVGYWKMNEGHGTVVIDYARARNIHLPSETWNVENTNLAAHLDGEHIMRVPIGGVSPRNTDSYVVETWFRGEKDKNARATLLSVTDRVSIGFDYDNSMILHIYNDTLSSLNSNGVPIVLTNVDYNDGNWHHIALNVHRGVSAVVYLDGKAVKTLAEQQLPAAAGDYLYVGGILKRSAQNPQVIEESYRFTGDIDELRVWNAACDGTSIIANRYNQVDTAHVTGLIAYYPMEHSVLDANGNIVTEFSLINNAPGMAQLGMGEAIGPDVVKASTAPALRKSPLKQNLDFDFTASNNEIYINLNTLPSRMQGNLLTFIVKNVRDIHDNLSETITWSAVVDYSTLEWEEDVLQVEKDRLSETITWATLRNKGRESGRFNISGLPSWIEPSMSTGVLGTGESVSIDFIIGADAPVGTHMIYAYAVNDDDISAPLMLVVTIVGNDPNWSFNPDDAESTMNMIGQIYLNDKICTNTNTKIAAFVDGNCCGVASPKLVASRDAYFVNLTVYGVEDVTHATPIVFRIYDAERGVVLGNVKARVNGMIQDVTYQPNGIAGNYDSPVMWYPSDMVEQQCDLATGWNWISLYVQPEQGKADLESILGHAKVFNTIKGKEGFAMNSGTKWTSTGLDTLAIGNLYKFKVKSDVNLCISGSMIDTRTTTQTIYPGWNWIGPLSIYNLSLNEAFADLMPTRGDIVKSKTQVAFYDGYKWEGDLTAVVPGLGYYYKSCSNQPITFRYPTIDANTHQAPAIMKSAPAGMPFTPVDHYQFSDNMNVVAKVMDGDMEIDNLCLAAFVDGECRGATYATPDGYYMLTVAGNAEEAGKPVRFATIYNGDQVWFSEELPWLSDWIYGDLDEPQVLDLEKSSGVENLASSSSIVITPAVVTDVVNVSSSDILKEVNVYSINGKLLDHFTPDGNHATLNLSHLIDGVYFVEARTFSGTRAIKQILKR